MCIDGRVQRYQGLQPIPRARFREWAGVTAPQMPIGAALAADHDRCQLTINSPERRPSREEDTRWQAEAAAVC
jgi:hypothetical protein